MNTHSNQAQQSTNEPTAPVLSKSANKLSLKRAIIRVTNQGSHEGGKATYHCSRIRCTYN